MYIIKYEEVNETPVELSSSNLLKDKKKMELVPKTENEILKLTITGEVHDKGKSSSTLQKLISKNDLVISYSWKGKTYYAALKNIKVLEPFAAM